MGIKENLAQPGNSLNIHEVTVQLETAKSELFFDLQKDITPEDLANIIKELRIEKDSTGKIVRCELSNLVELKLLSEKYFQLALNNTGFEKVCNYEENEREMRYLRSSSSDPDPDQEDLVNHFYNLKICFPDKFDSFVARAKNDIDFSWWMAKFVADKKHRECKMQTLFFLVSIFPEKRAMLKTVEENLRIENFSMNKDSSFSLFNEFVWLKALFPAWLSQQKIDLDTIIQYWKREFDKNKKKKNWIRLITNVKILRMLMAKEIKITEKGMEIIMPEVEMLQETNVPLPERRKF